MMIGKLFKMVHVDELLRDSGIERRPRKTGTELPLFTVSILMLGAALGKQFIGFYNAFICVTDDLSSDKSMEKAITEAVDFSRITFAGTASLFNKQMLYP